MRKVLKKLWQIAAKCLKKLLSKLLSFADRLEDAIQARLPLKRIILLESYPDFSDNTMAVFHYLRTQMDKHHFRMVWITEVDGTAPEGSSYVNWRAGRKHQRKWERLRRRAKVMVSCNRFILTAVRKGQITVFLTHGYPIKGYTNYIYGDKFDYVLSQSNWLAPYVVEGNQMEARRLVHLGMPRNDELYHPGDALSRMNFLGYRKVIIWLPTFRQHRGGRNTDTDLKANATGFPIIGSQTDLERLEDFLSQRGCLLVLKPHPAQDLRYIRLRSAPHIILIDNDLLTKKGVSLYSLLGASDAMLTDYSSVYYDYLLCHKPIGLTVDDQDTYEEKRGFVFEDPRQVFKGAYLKDIDDLLEFISDVADGKFPCQREVEDSCRMINDFQDDGSSYRVGDFIIDLLDKREADYSLVPEKSSSMAMMSGG